MGSMRPKNWSESMYLGLEDFKKRIEYSICQQFASEDDVRAFCRRAMAAGVGVACVNPVNVKLAAAMLGGTGIEISANIGFPFGSHLTEVKVLETRRAVDHGATQIDMVAQVGALRSGRDERVHRAQGSGRWDSHATTPQPLVPSPESPSLTVPG